MAKTLMKKNMMFQEKHGMIIITDRKENKMGINTTGLIEVKIKIVEGGCYVEMEDFNDFFNNRSWVSRSLKDALGKVLKHNEKIEKERNEK